MVLSNGAGVEKPGPWVDNSINPFKNEVLENLTLGQKIQIAICSFTIVPIRIILLILSFAFLWPIGAILARGRTDEEKKVPLAGWRKTFLPVAKFFSRCVFWSAGYQWIKITGKPDPEVKIFSFAPHAGFFDSMLITYMDFVSVVGRIEAKDVLIFGNLTDLCQPIYVNREDANCRSKSFEQINERVNSSLPWPQLSMFTEGTTTNGRALIKFKTGAFRPGKPVQPVCFVYDQTIMDTATWTWDCPHWALLSWLSLCQIHSPVEFIFMPTYYPNEAEIADPELFAENVRRAMAQRMNIPLSDYSYEDARVAHKCMKYGLPSSSGLVEINKLKKEVNASIDEIYEIIPMFAKLANCRTGVCHIDKFAQNLGVVLNTPVEKLFNMFDVENSGRFLLKDFIKTYFLVVNKLDKEKSIEKVLEMVSHCFEGDLNSCTSEELKLCIQKKLNVEFIKFGNLDECVDKDWFREFLKRAPLILYLLAVVDKK